MKKTVAIILAFLFIFAACSCNTDQPANSSEAGTESDISATSELTDESSPKADESSEDPAVSENDPAVQSDDDSSEAAQSENPGPDQSEEPDPVQSDEPDPESSEDSAQDDPDQSKEPDPDQSEEPEPEPAYTNLAAGKKYKVNSPAFRTDQYGDADDVRGTKMRYKLTDNKFAEAGDSGDIAGFNQAELDFIIDLEHDYKVDKFSVDFWGGPWDIADPTTGTFKIYISSDGKKYTEIGAVTEAGTVDKTVGDFKRIIKTLQLDEPVETHYVRFHIKTERFIWISELQAFGESKIIPTIPRVFIDLQGDDRVHRSAYHTCGIELVDPSGTFDLISDDQAQIKIRGNSTSSGDKKPYNIKFSTKQNVLGMGKCKKWYLIANMYDKTQMRNKLAFDFADDIGMDYVQQSTFVRVYINGTYQGIYQLCESIGVGKSRVDIDTKKNEFLLEFEPWPQYSNENYIYTARYNILLGFNDPETPTDEQRAYLDDFFSKAETAIMTRNYKQIEQYLDIDSFIDDYLVQEYFKQVDYQTSSTRFYIKDGKWYAGPVWDFDLSSGNCSSTYYTGYNNVNTSGLSWEGLGCTGLWNSRLFACTEIMERLKKRYLEIQPYIVNLYQDNELGKCKIDALLDAFGNEIALNYTVWSTSGVYSELERIPTDGTYESEIVYLKDWLKHRNEWLLDYYGLS